jgi:phosphoribosyl 1,2-cyclic phosphodiesterase
MSNNSVYTLYSGSDGNAVYFNLAGHHFLIDAGKSARSLCAALREVGTDISRIEAIFITHEHSDHTSALEIVEKYNSIPIHIVSRSAEKLKGGKNQYLLPNLVTHPPIFCERLGCVKISSFETPHDSRCSVGYRIEFTDGDGDHKIGLATDIGRITDSIRRGLTGCDSVIIEANHDVEMLLCGPYPEHL